MNSTLAIVLNVDTRQGWLEPNSHIGKTGPGSLQGVRSSDFLLHLPHTIQKFFHGWPGEVQLIMCVDKHEELPPTVGWELARLQAEGVIHKAVIKEHDHSKPRQWNDYMYNRCLRLAADADYICHLDQDVALFRNPESQILQRMKDALDSGEAKFCCQPILTEPPDLDFPSTRFFLTKRSTLDFDELDRAIDRIYRISKYGSAKHVACYEGVLGLVAANNEKINYPLYDPTDWVCFSWVCYRAGLLPMLNDLSYAEVQDFIKQGALCGPMDFIPKDV